MKKVDSGCVYVLDCRELGENHFKIGCTSKRSYLNSRKSKIRKSYGLTSPSEFLYVIDSVDHYTLEASVHNFFRDERLGDRELFRVDLDLVIPVIERFEFLIKDRLRK